MSKDSVHSRESRSSRSGRRSAAVGHHRGRGSTASNQQRYSEGPQQPSRNGNNNVNLYVTQRGGPRGGQPPRIPDTNLFLGGDSESDLERLLGGGATAAYNNYGRNSQRPSGPFNNFGHSNINGRRSSAPTTINTVDGHQSRISARDAVQNMFSNNSFRPSLVLQQPVVNRPVAFPIPSPVMVPAPAPGAFRVSGGAFRGLPVVQTNGGGPPTNNVESWGQSHRQSVHNRGNRASAPEAFLGATGPRNDLSGQRLGCGNGSSQTRRPTTTGGSRSGPSRSRSNNRSNDSSTGAVAGSDSRSSTRPVRPGGAFRRDNDGDRVRVHIRSAMRHRRQQRHPILRSCLEVHTLHTAVWAGEGRCDVIHLEEEL